MKNKSVTLLAAIIPLALATVAFAFAIKATSSREWSIRHQYNTSLYEEQWSKPLLTEYRSPFTICTQNATNATALVCQTFSPTDTNRTSCEPLSVTNDSLSAQSGDERLCQEIHWSGNLAIASTVSIGIGFLIVMTMALFSVVAVLTSGLVGESDQDQDADRSNEAEATKDGVVSSATEGHAKHHRRRPRHRRHPRTSAAASYLNFAAIFTFVVGAVLFVFAQFYGILAFTVNAPDNGQYAAYGETPNNGQGYLHGPWIQGNAISIYASIAWAAAGAAALSAGVVWSLPSARRYSVLTE